MISHKNDKRSLKARRPDLVEEWDYEQNGSLKPEHVTEYSHKKVWWLCEKCGHSWEALIYSRSNGAGCPCCNGKVVIKGKTDLKTLRPDIAAEWDYEKNEGMRPEDFTEFSNTKVWWLCEKCGHSWRATIDNRSRGRGCPCCSGRVAKKGWRK